MTTTNEGRPAARSGRDRGGRALIWMTRGAVSTEPLRRRATGGSLGEQLLERLSPADYEFLAWALTRGPGFEVERPVARGSPAAAAAAELRRRAAGVASSIGSTRMQRRHPIRRLGASGTAQNEFAESTAWRAGPLVQRGTNRSAGCLTAQRPGQ